eukprot:3390334-Prymnesium_polylepis.1
MERARIRPCAQNHTRNWVILAAEDQSVGNTAVEDALRGQRIVPSDTDGGVVQVDNVRPSREKATAVHAAGGWLIGKSAKRLALWMGFT